MSELPALIAAVTALVTAITGLVAAIRAHQRITANANQETKP